MSVNLANAFNLVLKLHSRPATIERPGGSEIVSGLTIPDSINLSSNINDGLAYIEGQRIVIAETPITFTALKDTYIEITSTGLLNYVEVNNGAVPPGVVGSNLRFAKVVTNGVEVTAITMLKTPKGIYGISATPIRVTTSNYFRNLEAVEETVFTGREFVISKQVLDAAFYPTPKRGDRIKDEDLGVSTVTEVREMSGLGGAIIGYRVRTS